LRSSFILFILFDAKHARNFDPLNPQTVHQISSKQILPILLEEINLSICQNEWF